jgi:hypothetical protein
MLLVEIQKVLYAATNDDAGQLRCRANAFLGRKKKSFKASTRRQRHPTTLSLRHLNPPIIFGLERRHLLHTYRNCTYIARQSFHFLASPARSLNKAKCRTLNFSKTHSQSPR